MAVLIDVFPCTFRHSVRFMHNADMGILLVLRSPPVPAQTMSRAMSECVQMFYVLPVGDGHQSIAACSSHLHGVRFSEIYHRVSYRAVRNASKYSQPHLKVIAYIRETWREKTHWAVSD